MNKYRCSSEFDQIALPHLDAAYNLARWLIGDPSAAEYVVKGAFLRAWRGSASFRGVCERAWVLRMVHQAAYCHINVRRERTEISFGGGTEPSEEGDSPVGIPNPAWDAGQLFSALPVELRECLVLRELEELSYKEIAQVTGVPIGTVICRLARARQTLAQLAA